MKSVLGYSLLIIVALGTFFIFGFYSDRGLGFISASILRNTDKTEEKKLFKPLPVIIDGDIISIMNGGLCIGIRPAFDIDGGIIGCYEEDEEPARFLWEYSGRIKISGYWTGITCAYKNTIFKSCVPEIIIGNVEKL